MFIWKNNMLICRSDLRFRKHWGYVKIYPSIDYRYSYLYYDWYLFIFFYYYKYHRHYYRIYYYHFLFYPKRTFFFPRVTICFLGGFFSKKNLASKVIAHLKRIELLMLNNALSNFISRSLGFCRTQFLLPCSNEYL